MIELSITLTQYSDNYFESYKRIYELILMKNFILEGKDEMDIEKEKREIEKTIQKFFDGFDNLNADLINEAFYNEKIEMLTIRESGKLKKSPISSFSKWFEKIKSQSDNILNIEKSKKNIIYIDVTGRAANVKVEYIFSTYKWVEYYNFLKIENRWYIVNKIFDTLYPE